MSDTEPGAKERDRAGRGHHKIMSHPGLCQKFPFGFLSVARGSVYVRRNLQPFCTRLGSSQKSWDEADAVQGLGQMCCTNPGVSCTFQASPDEFKMFRMEETWKRGNIPWVMSCNISGTSTLHEEFLIPLLFPDGTTE